MAHNTRNITHQHTTVEKLDTKYGLGVVLYDASGNQITSFGGGTQYTEGDTDSSITGTASLMEGAGNTLLPVQGTVADGLLVNLGSNNDVVGAKSHDGGAPGATNLGVLPAVATAAAPSFTEGRQVGLSTDLTGSLRVVAKVPTRASSNGTPIAATTTSVIAAPAASNHLRIIRFLMSNGGATSTWVALRDGAAGTQYYRTFLPLNGVISLNLSISGPLDLTTATRLDIVLSAAGSVEYTVDYFTVPD